jgi:hypothetical protein
MHPDRYTRVVLTVIAAALVWICVRDAIPTVHASNPSQLEAPFAQYDERNPLRVTIVGIERGEWVVRTGPFPQDQKTVSQPWQPIEVITR